jgi:hypothetical protein
MIVKNFSHHPQVKLQWTPAEKASFEAETSRLVYQAKMATLACYIFADNHRNQLPTNFAQLNAQRQETKLSDANWEFVASGDRGGFADPDATIYFLEKEPKPSPDGKFVKIYATVNGRVFLVTSPDEDFTAAEKGPGFLVQRATN